MAPANLSVAAAPHTPLVDNVEFAAAFLTGRVSGDTMNPTSIRQRHLLQNCNQSMAIYGTALLSLCLLTGLLVGKLLGMAVGVDANVGGVGVAMLLLIVLSGRLQSRGWMPPPTRSGVTFWSSVYIPIVVAMAASQNVRAALSGGAVAIVAGSLAVAVCFALVPLLNQIGDAPVVDGDERDKGGGGVQQ